MPAYAADGQALRRELPGNGAALTGEEVADFVQGRLGRTIGGGPLNYYFAKREGGRAALIVLFNYSAPAQGTAEIVIVSEGGFTHSAGVPDRPGLPAPAY
jgi:hypothetical protein